MRPRESEPRHAGLIMIVDDKTDLRALLGAMLRQVGYDTLEAGNGREACRLLEAGTRPAVILLDVTMPVMDGWEFLRVAKPSMPVILMTGTHPLQPQLVPDCIAAVLDKPVNSGRLLNLVNDLCDGAPRS